MHVLNLRRTRTNARLVGKAGCEGMGPSARPSLVNLQIDKLLTHTDNFSPTLEQNLTLSIRKVQTNHTRQQHVFLTKSTVIVDAGATDIYFSTDAAVVNIDRASPKVTVGTATGQTQQSLGTGNPSLPHLLLRFPINGHIMPGFRHNLIGVGPLCDVEYTVTFTSKEIIIRNNQGTTVLTSWSVTTGTKLCQITLQPGESNLPSIANYAKKATLVAYSAYDLPSAAALIRYFHAVVGYPFRSTCLKADCF